MPNNHRNELLDSYLGKEVAIEFLWGEVRTGILHWSEPGNEYYGWGHKRGMYILDDKIQVRGFRKSHVKTIKELRYGRLYSVERLC